MAIPTVGRAEEKATETASPGWPYAVFYFLIFMGLGVLSTYQNVYFQRRGLSKTEIGYLSSVGS
ncbi:MAG: hypothetical protein C4321_08210, partial [Chloroflexota bacterium]